MDNDLIGLFKSMIASLRRLILDWALIFSPQVLRRFCVAIQGFTLVELLISMAIMGMIATFTIPKVLLTQRNDQFNAIAKETAGTLSSAYQAQALRGSVTTNTSSADITQYINYVKADTASVIDGDYGTGTATCSIAEPCLLMHNGGMLKVIYSCFGGSTTTNTIWFLLDPDGRVTDGTTNGPGKSIALILTYNNRVITPAELATSSTDWGCDGTDIVGANPGAVPPWFNW